MYRNTIYSMDTINAANAYRTERMRRRFFRR